MSSNALVNSLCTPAGTHSNTSDDNSSTATIDKINVLEVYAPDTKVMYAIPRTHIVHFGTNSTGKLLLCKSHSFCQSGEEQPVCREGSQCRYVHIDVPLNQLKGDIIHVHYIYREPSLCIYERLSTVAATLYPQLDKLTALTIFGPHQQRPAESLTATRMLRTEGALKALAALVQGDNSVIPCHCAHYYYAQTCNRGASCSFIHVVSIDPSQERDSTRPSTFRKRMQATSEVGLSWPHFNPQAANSLCSLESSILGTNHSSLGKPLMKQAPRQVLSPPSPSTAQSGLAPHKRMLSTSSEITLDTWGGDSCRDGTIFRQESFQPSTPGGNHYGLSQNKILALAAPQVDVLSVPMGGPLCEAETSNRSTSVSRCATPAYQQLVATPNRYAHNPYFGSQYSPSSSPVTAAHAL